MAILFAGTSLADFILTGSPAVDTTAARINTEALEGVQVDPQESIEIRLPTKLTDFWLAFHVYDNGTGTILAPEPQIAFYDMDYGANELFGLFFKPNATSQTISSIGIRTAAETLTYHDLFTKNVNGVALTRIDIHIVFGNSGRFDVFAEGVLIASFTGDTDLLSASGINRIRLTKDNNGGGGATTYSGVFVANEDTRNMNFVGMAPLGSGANSGWTGAYTDIDETGYSDTDYISTTTVDAVSTFNFGNIPTKYANYKVKAVAIGARAAGSGGSPDQVNGALRTGGVNYDKASELPTPVAFAPINVIWQTNPGTGVEFTIAEVDAAEFGFKAIA